MFVCPNCGYRLPPCWKAHRHFLYAYYCRLDEFEQFYPSAFVELLEKEGDIHNVSCSNPFEKGDFTFHITNPRTHKNPRYVILILTEFKDFIYRRDLVERHVAARNLGQLELQKFSEGEK